MMKDPTGDYSLHDQLAIEELFSTALKLPKQDRSHWVNASSIDQADKQAVLRLLRAHEQGSVWLNDNIFSDAERIDAGFLDSLLGEEHSCPILKAGTQLDDYRIVDEIGRGGMSIVYKAKQAEPIDRTVALKIIRPHLLSPQALRRFIREQQALAMVSHPNIATLFGVGTSDNGQPYAAMEFVEGVPIDVYCDMQRLTVDERLLVFQQVCVALQHAHEHGVIHRDVKPNNILVYDEQREPRVKLIDFGVAKLLESHAPDETCVTRFGQLIGSPRYMSPEQMGGHGASVETDVYAAGLVLFELIAGSAYRQSDDFLSISKSFTDERPELASERIQSSVSSGDSLATFRNTNERKLLRRVRRDLDWILAKALTPRIEGRYGSIDELLSDINRSLAGEPVSAARPTVGQRIKRFTHKNKWLLIGMCASASLLLELTAFSYWHKSKESDPTLIRLQTLLSPPVVSRPDSTDSPK